MKQERIRISDIAEELGLRTATVSNVIHGKTKKVSEETIKRVQELLEKRQYFENCTSCYAAVLISIFLQCSRSGNDRTAWK